MWELDHKESWAPKSWCFWTVGLEKTLECPLDCKEIQPVHPKGNQSWIFIGRTDTEAEAPILWPPDSKNWLTGKDPDAGKEWRKEEKGMTEDEMAGLHHWLDRHEFEQAPRVGNGQGSLESCSPWGHKESDMTEWLNWPHHLSLSLSGLGPILYVPTVAWPSSFWNLLYCIGIASCKLCPPALIAYAPGRRFHVCVVLYFTPSTQWVSGPDLGINIKVINKLNHFKQRV